MSNNPICRANVPRHVHPQAVIRPDTRYRPDRTIPNDLLYLYTRRQQPRPEILHQEAVVGYGSLVERLCLGGVESDGLLAEDVLTGDEGRHGILEVVGMGGGDVDDFDILRGEEGIVAVVGDAGE